MTEFSCSVCKYTSAKKENVARHIKKKSSCGTGIREIIEIPKQIICQYCNKNFSTATSLFKHQKDNCKHKDDIKDEEIRRLKEELKKAKSVTINNTDNSTTINIFINNYEDTDLSKLTDKIYNKIINDAEEVHQIIPSFIKAIHFNPNIPENHNIVLSNRNKNNKHLQIYKDKHWEITNKDAEIDNLINDKETNISDWVAEKGDKYPEAVEKYNEYLEKKYDDDETVKQVKEEVELVLYNNKHMVKI